MCESLEEVIESNEKRIADLEAQLLAAEQRVKNLITLYTNSQADNAAMLKWILFNEEDDHPDNEKIHCSHWDTNGKECSCGLTAILEADHPGTALLEELERLRKSEGERKAVIDDALCHNIEQLEEERAADKERLEAAEKLIVLLWKGRGSGCPICKEPMATDFHKDDCLVPQIVPSQMTKSDATKTVEAETKETG